ncbi:hypothetical protein GF420_01050 [candidate division GN15 bacterium]|nr:hypothetical protein [candidate division GN15 bacterium]
MKLAIPRSPNRKNRGHLAGQRVVLMCTLVILSSLPCRSRSESHQSDEQPTQDITSDKALELAIEYTGFNRYVRRSGPSTASSIELVSFQDSTVPYQDFEVAVPAWEVVFDSVVLGSRSQCSLAVNFHVWLDADDGHFIMAKREATDSVKLTPQPKGTAIESQVRQAVATFRGLPKSPPKIDLVHGMEKAVFSKPCKAKEVYVYLFSISNFDESAVKAVWCVVGRTTPAMPHSGLSGKPPPEFENWITVVDAETCEPMWGVNIE